jgi:hypothetical protein
MVYSVKWQGRKNFNKYNSRKQEYNGRTYHSMKEANYAAELDLLKRAGEIKDWIPQFRIEFIWNGYHIGDYLVDFKVIMLDGTIEFREVKGYETDMWRWKWRMCEAMFAKDIQKGKVKLVLIK